MKYLPTIALLAAVGCGGIQTRPTCKEEQYGIIDIVNNTDEYKVVSVHRIIHDGERYKTVGDPFRRGIEPMTSGRIRVHPGLVLVVIDTVKGVRWMRAFKVIECAVVTIAMKNDVVFKDLPAIQSRRALVNCPPCDPCGPNENRY